MKRLDNHVVIGMAGHIDHGKTSIIKALTGTNTDRLKEEIERGMTTDLGFAFMGDDITIIDVPGHEKFVKTMVAGVTTVDMALFVIAADDGIMPQTVEHHEILSLLGVRRGIVVLNKIDMVEPEWLELVESDIREMLSSGPLKNAEIVPVSAVKNINIDILKEKIMELAHTVPPRNDSGLFRMYIDRVFTIKGFGTVVAGTVLSGVLKVDDAVSIQPRDEQSRVRGIQVHGKKVNQTEVGIRAAINITVDKDDVERGDMLAEPGFCQPTSMIDVQVRVLKSAPRALKNRDRVRVHLGTAEVMARAGMIGRESIEPGDEGFIQLRFEKPVSGERHDRFVIRSYSPMQTIAGGEIVDPHPKKHKMTDDDALKQVEQLYEGDPNQFVIDHFDRNRFMPLAVEDIAKSLAVTNLDMERRLDHLLSENRVVKVGKKRFVSTKNYDTLRIKSLLLLQKYMENNRLKLSMSSAELKSQIRLMVDPNLFKTVLEQLTEEGSVEVHGDALFIPGRVPNLTETEQTVKLKLLALYQNAGLSTPSVVEALDIVGASGKDMLDLLIDSQELIRVEESILFSREPLRNALTAVKKRFETQELVTIHDFRELFGDVSRKYVVAILSYADKIGLTDRAGDARRLRNPEALTLI